MIDNREAARWRRIVDALRAEAARLGDPRARARKQVEIGDTLFDRLGDAYGAAEAWLAAIETCPESPDDALRRLERLARDSKDGKLYQRWVAGLRRAGRWTAVIDLMGRRADALRDPRKRCKLRLEGARLAAEKRGDAARARRLLIAAAEDADKSLLERVRRPLMAHLRETPHDEDAATALARLLARCEKPDDAIELLVETAAHLRDLTRKAALLYEAAFLCERAGRLERAPALLRDTLVFDPRREGEVLARLEALEKARPDPLTAGALLDGLIEAWDGLERPQRSQRLLAERVAGASGRAMADLRLRQARHAEEVLQDAGRAFELYQAVAATAADPAPAIEGLRRTADGRAGAFEVIADLCTRRGLQEALAELCTDEAALRVDDGERAALLHRAGATYEALGDLERAMARFVEAFKLRPRELKYLEAGKRLYVRQGDWAMVDRLMGLEVEVLAEPSSKRAALVEQARLRWEKLGDGLGAYDALRDALRRLGETTAEDGAFAMLEGLVADAVSFEAIAGGLRTRAETEDDGAHRLVELAGLHLDLRDEPAIGLELLREAVDRAPADGKLFVDVAARIGRHAGPEAEAELQRSALSRPLPVESRIEATRRAARLLAAIEPADALAMWQALATLDPDDPTAIDGAVNVAESLGPVAAGRVAELLRGALDGTRGPSPDPERRVRWQRALARAEGRRVAPEAERAAWLGLLDLVPDDPEALAAVQPILEAAGDWQGWAARLAAAIEAAERAEVLADGHRLALAALYEANGRPGEAARWLLPLAQRADGGELRARVFALFEAAGDRPAAIDLARRTLKALERDRAAASAEPEDERTDVRAAPVDPAALSAARLAVAERLMQLAEAEGDETGLTIALLAASDERPDDPRPALRLAELARRTGDERALLVALTRLSDQTPGPRGVPLRREIARLLTDQKDDEAALAAWQGVLGDAADDTEALAALQKLHARAGDDQTVHRLLWQRQAATDDVEDRIGLLKEAAIVAEFRLGSTEEAARAWRAVLALDGQHADALDEMIRLSEDEGRFRETLAAAEVRVAQLRGHERADLARRMAEICDGPLGDEPGAVVWWHVVAEEEPDDGEALEALAADAERRGASDLALMLWARLAGGRPGRLQQTALKRRAALLAAADDLPGAMQAWRALAAARPDDPEPWRAFAAAAQAADDLQGVAEAQGALAERLTGDERADALRARARILDELGDPAATGAWEAVLALDPHDGEGLAATAFLHGAAGRPLEMLRALDMLVAVAEPAQGIGRLAAAADQMESAGDARTAFECWRRVHHLRREVDGESIDAMRRLAGPAERWNAFAEALAESAGRSDVVDVQRGFMLEAAAVWADRLGDTQRAFAQAQAACALAPAHPEALARLEILAAAVGDDRAWAGLSEALKQGSEADPSKRARLLVRAAEINERHRRREDVAFALLSRAFEGPDCVGEMGAAVEAALVRLARRGQRWPEVIELFDTRARLLEAPRDQAALLHRLGMVLERDAGRVEQAFEQYLLALQLDPLDRGIRDSAWRLAHTLDMWSVVERVVRLALENADGPRARAAVLRVMAELQAGPLQDEDEGFKTLKRAFAMAPGEVATRTALEAAAGSRGLTATLAPFYEDEAGWAESQDDRIALYRAAVAAYTAHGQQVEAARVLRKLDRLLPGDADLAAERLELLRMADDARPLAEALQRQIEQAQGAHRLDLLRELATVRAERLDDAQGAEAAWRRILDARPHDADAFAALTTSLTARRAWKPLDEALARRIEGTTAATRRGLMRRRAELLHTRLGRPVEAFDLLAEVSRAEPADLDLLDVLAKRAPIAEGWAELVACAERAVAVAPRARVAGVLMLVGRTARDRLDDPRKALSALGRALERRPDDLALAREVAALMTLRRQFGPLVELHRRVGPDLVAEPGEHPVVVQARWSLALAELLAERLYRVDEAIEVVRGLVAQQSLNLDALRRLRALCETAQDGPGLHDAVERLAGLATGVERLSTLVEGARALASMGETERAVAVWRTVLGEAPGHPEAQRAVARQAARHEDWALMVEQLEARIRAAHGPDERADLLCELAVLHLHRRADPAAAGEAYDRALAAAPAHLDALVGHVELGRKGADAGDLGRLAELLGAHVARPEGRGVLLPLYVDLQLDRVLALTATDDTGPALQILETLSARVPDDTRVGQHLADALYGAGELKRAAALYATLPMPAADPSGDGEQRARQHLRRARALGAAGETDLAMRHFDAATGHAATRACALEQLANLQERAGRWEAAARLREKLADAVEDPQARRAAWVAAGLILEHRLGRAVRAMQAYDQAVDGGLGEPVLLGGILRLYRAQARAERVLQVSELLLARDPAPRRRAELWCDRAWALAALGDAAGAREARRAALLHDPSSAEAAEGVFVGLERAGDVERAETVEVARSALAALQGEARVPLLVALRDWSAARSQTLRRLLDGQSDAPGATIDTPGATDDAPIDGAVSDSLTDDALDETPAPDNDPPTDPERDQPRSSEIPAAGPMDDESVVSVDGLFESVDDLEARTSPGRRPPTAPEDPRDADGSLDDSASLSSLDVSWVSLDDGSLEGSSASLEGSSVSLTGGGAAEGPAMGVDASLDDGDSSADMPPAPQVDPEEIDPAEVERLADDAEAFAAELVSLRPDEHRHRVRLARLIGARAERSVDQAARQAILEQAIPHRRAAVRLRPGDTADLRTLAEVCEAAGHTRWARVPRSVLALIGAGDPPPPLHADLPSPLAATQRKAHLAGSAWRSPAGLLLNALHTWIARPLDGLLREARGEPGAPAESVDPALAAEAVDVAAVLGLAFPAMRIDPEADTPMELAGLAPPIPVIGRPILEMEDPRVRRFALARGFELMRGCAAHAAYVPAGEARALFVGAVALARPADGADYALRVDAPPGRVAWWAELLNELLDARRLDALARFAGPVAAGSEDAFARWAEGTRRAADRVALWLAGDPAAALVGCWQAEPALAELRPASPRALRTLVEASPRVAALHRAMFGDGVFALLAAEAPAAEAPLDEGPSLDEVAAELAAAAVRGEVVDRPAAIERLGGEPTPDDTLDGYDPADDASLDASWSRPAAPPTVEVAAPVLGDAPRDDDDAAGVSAADASFDSTGDETGGRAPDGEGEADGRQDVQPPPALGSAPAASVEPDAAGLPLDDAPGSAAASIRPTVEVAAPILPADDEPADDEPADDEPALSPSVAPEPEAAGQDADPPETGADDAAAIVVRRSPPSQPAAPVAHRAVFEAPPTAPPAIIESPPDDPPVEPEALLDGPQGLEPTTAPPGPLAGPLADALIDDAPGAADLGAAADAGPPLGLDGDDRDDSRLVGAVAPGPAASLPGIDHLFDDLADMLADAEGDPTDAVPRAALLDDGAGMPDGPARADDALLPPVRVETSLDAAPQIEQAARSTHLDLAAPLLDPPADADRPEGAVITAVTRIAPPTDGPMPAANAADDPAEQTRDDAPPGDGALHDRPDDAPDGER